MVATAVVVMPPHRHADERWLTYGFLPGVPNLHGSQSTPLVVRNFRGDDLTSYPAPEHFEIECLCHTCK